MINASCAPASNAGRTLALALLAAVLFAASFFAPSPARAGDLFDLLNTVDRVLSTTQRLGGTLSYGSRSFLGSNQMIYQAPSYTYQNRSVTGYRTVQPRISSQMIVRDNMDGTVSLYDGQTGQYLGRGYVR
mgnify:FL=1